MTPFLDLASDSGFGLANLPYGVFSTAGHPARVGVRLGDWVVDLDVLEQHGLIAAAGAGRGPVFNHASLNAFMALGADACSLLTDLPMARTAEACAEALEL